MGASLEPAAPPTPERLKALVDELTSMRMEQLMARSAARTAHKKAARLDMLCSDLRDQIDAVVEKLSNPTAAGVVHD